MPTSFTSASHRLNLAVQRFMADHDFLLNKIQDLMRKLRNLNHSANFGKFYCVMIGSFYVIEQAAAPAGRFARVQVGLEEAAERRKVTLLDVRDLFETLIERHPSDAEYLAANASVVKNPAFENACVKVLLGKEMELTGNNHELLAAFATPVSSRPSNDEDDSNDRDGFANLCVRARYSVSKLECAVASRHGAPGSSVYQQFSDDENTPPNPKTNKHHDAKDGSAATVTRSWTTTSFPLERRHLPGFRLALKRYTRVGFPSEVPYLSPPKDATTAPGASPAASPARHPASPTTSSPVLLEMSPRPPPPPARMKPLRARHGGVRIVAKLLHRTLAYIPWSSE
ncbi:hypothetical protein GQ600_7590 [Phytophthora cactorum]|nr:hypothetical protein GQ600_7590 [Phytophthora cactorum]